MLGAAQKGELEEEKREVPLQSVRLRVMLPPDDHRRLLWCTGEKNKKNSPAVELVYTAAVRN